MGKRSADDEEDEDEDDENDVVEAIVKANVKEDEEAAEAVAEQDAEDDDEEEFMTDDAYPDILGNAIRGGRSYNMYETTHEEEDEDEVIDYRDWYDNVYLPWYADWEREMNEYKLKMLKYEAAHYQVSNPFGDISFGNPYPFYSKASYTQSLFDD